MNPKQKAFQKASEGIISNLAKGQMNAYFCESKEDCLTKITELIKENSIISWGGSESVRELGILDVLSKGNYQLLDRLAAKTPDESRALFSKIVLSDYYFMSTNALTLQGEFINIDGNGNRLSCLLQGPKEVFLIVGMNKIVSNLENGYLRIKNIVAPANSIRLERKTPCTQTGKCENCFSPECICSHTVITRRCSQKGRITVFLIAEDLGY